MATAPELALNLDGMALADLLRRMEASDVSVIWDRHRPKRQDDPRESVQLYLSDVKPNATPAAGTVERLRALWTGPNRLRRSTRKASGFHARPTPLDFEESPLQIDHTSCYTRDGRFECVVTEPYRLDADVIAKLLPFLETNGLAGYVHLGAETYYPGRAFAIVFVRKGSEADFPTLDAAIRQATAV